MRYLLLTLISLLLHISVYGRNLITSIEELNHTPHALNSHAECEQRSSLEMDFNSMRILTNEELDKRGPAIYPRIKQMENGEWLLLFQGYRIGSYIYYCISKDKGESWSYRKVLFRPYAVTTSRGEDQRRFSTADAVVLQNGDILVVCSYRAHKGYSHSVDCGLMLRRSKDNGKSWNNEEIIYQGTNWEPFLLQLPDGRVQCYFTDNNPSIGDSGTSVIVSADNGNSWSEKTIVCRQHRHTYEDGTRIYTDQMPSFRLLNDGKTLLGFMEGATYTPNSKDRHYRMSVVRQHGTDWSPLTGDMIGPTDRDTYITRGAGGYVATFPSGETVLSCNIDSKFSLKVGNHRGDRFNGSWDNDWLQPFKYAGYWGSTEVLDSHRLLAAIHCKKGIQHGILYLNHDIAAPRLTVKIDGKNSEWKHDEALFVGSDSPSQMLLRAAYDDENIYLLVECKSDDREAFARVDINTSHSLLITRKGCSGGKGLQVKCRKAESTTVEKGFIAEVAIPRKQLQGALSIWCAITANGISDTLSVTNKSDIASLPQIVLK